MSSCEFWEILRNSFFKRLLMLLTFVVLRYRSSRSQMFFKIGFLKTFANFIEKKTVLESLFNKVAGLRVSNFVKKRLQY